MENKMFGLLLTLTVGIIMIGALVAPIVASYGYEDSNYYNEGMPYAAVDDDTHTIVISSSAITVDGTAIDQTLFPTSLYDQFTIVYSDGGFIRLDTTSVLVRNVHSSGIANYDYSEETVTITIAEDVATVSSTDTTAEDTTLSDITYYVASAGDYVLSVTPVVTSETVMRGAGQTTFTTSNSDVPETLNVYTNWSGTMSAVTASVYKYADTSVWGACEVSDVTVNSTDMDNGLYRIDSVVIDYTATYTSTSTDYEVSSTYTYFLVPAEIAYDNPNYIGFGVAGVMAALVVVCILSLVVMAAKGMENRTL